IRRIQWKWIRHINQLNEFAVLDIKLDTPYPMEVDTPYSPIDQNRSGVETTLDMAYPRDWIRRIQGIGYGVLEFLRRIDLLSFVVFGECRHGYAVSSLMDTAYWLSESLIFKISSFKL
ncbi:hypothetical protein Tco_1200570, partial [Tanacetum coccineum]